MSRFTKEEGFIMYDSSERQQLLINIARMYYFEHLSQQKIADILGMLRSNVSLLLKSCIENQVVEIKINDSISKAHTLASAIQKNSISIQY